MFKEEAKSPLIETLFDEFDTPFCKITFADGVVSYCSSGWQADLLLQRWNNETLALNYRGKNLGKLFSNEQSASQ